MSCEDRRETDATGRPVDIKNITLKARPWTREEAYIAKLAYWVRIRKRKQQWSEEAKTILREAVALRYRDEEADYGRLIAAAYLDETGEVLEAIGMMFFQRNSTDLDISKACRFFEIAYEKGIELRTELFVTMGSVRERGDEIVPKDPKLVLKWYQKAIDAGIRYAYACVGDIYFKGDIVERDYKKAYEMFMQSGEEEVLCLARLGEMYEHGMYVQADPVKAREYYERIVIDHRELEKYGDEDYEFARKRLAESC